MFLGELCGVKPYICRAQSRRGVGQCVRSVRSRMRKCFPVAGSPINPCICFTYPSGVLSIVCVFYRSTHSQQILIWTHTPRHRSGAPRPLAANDSCAWFCGSKEIVIIVNSSVAMYKFKFRACTWASPGPWAGQSERRKQRQMCWGWSARRYCILLYSQRAPGGGGNTPRRGRPFPAAATCARKCPAINLKYVQLYSDQSFRQPRRRGIASHEGRDD